MIRSSSVDGFYDQTKQRRFTSVIRPSSVDLLLWSDQAAWTDFCEQNKQRRLISVARLTGISDQCSFSRGSCQPQCNSSSSLSDHSSTRQTVFTGIGVQTALKQLSGQLPGVGLGEGGVSGEWDVAGPRRCYYRPGSPLLGRRCVRSCCRFAKGSLKSRFLDGLMDPWYLTPSDPAMFFQGEGQVKLSNHR